MLYDFRYVIVSEQTENGLVIYHLCIKNSVYMYLSIIFVSHKKANDEIKDNDLRLREVWQFNQNSAIM